MTDILLKERTDDGILILTLNRPEAMNCFNFDLLAELADIIKESNFDMDLRCIIITGAQGDRDVKKQSFSAGADLKREENSLGGSGPPFHLYNPQHIYGSGTGASTCNCGD